MSLPRIIAFLTERDGRSRQIVNDVVTSLNAAKQLPQMPDGNQDITIGWERSTIDWANFVNFGVPLGFVMQAAKILRNDFYKFNSDRELYLLLKVLTYEFTDTTYKEYYKQFYKGLLDFSQAKDKQGEDRFEIPIMSTDLQKKIKANETEKFDIPLDGDAKNINMDGMFITGVFRWLVTADTFQNEKYPSMYQLPNDNPIPGLAFFDVQKNGAGVTTSADTLEYFAEATQDIAGVTLSGLLVNVEYSFADLNIELIIFNTITGTIRDTIDLAPADPYAQNSNIIVNETFDLLKGDRLFFKVGVAPISFISLAESTLQLSAKSKALPSTVQAFTLYDLGRKLIQKLTGSADNFESNLLQLKNILITSFDGVRGISGASVKTSWQDFKRAVNVYCLTGVQITDKVRIEYRPEFFALPTVDKPAIILEGIKEFSCDAANDMLYTSVKIGHAEQQVDDTNGKYSFNGWHLYTTPIKSIPSRELDLTSPWKADPYEIEQTRANYEGKTTTDKTTDNDIVAIACKPDPDSNTFDTDATFQADGAPFAPGQPFANILAGIPKIRPGMKLRITGSALNNQDLTVTSSTPWFFGQMLTFNEPVVNETGIVITVEIIEGQYYNLDRDIEVTQLAVPDVETEVKETIYNIPLTPKRLLLIHAPWLAGCLYGYAPGELVFANTNRNKELIAGGIIEKANVSIASLGSPMFIPKYFNFKVSSLVNMPALMEANPDPVFDFPWKDYRYAGFLMLGGIAATTLEEQVFKLLSLPDNNLLNLI